MIVLSPEEMRDLDHRTIAAGTPGEVLMERAGLGVVAYLDRVFDLTRHRVAIVCGKGNNGGDGRVIQRVLEARGIPLTNDRPTLVIDAVLGIGLTGPARGEALEQIRWINAARSSGATVLAVDVPSGLGSGGEFVMADHTVTFAALKPVHVLPPDCDACGQVAVVDIGTLPVSSALHQTDPPVFAPRRRDSHKGDYGHVLVIAGSPGKTGAAALAGVAALRSGAGWVTVTAPVSQLYPELMTADFPPPFGGKDVVAVGPGLGLAPETVEAVREWYATCPLPMIVDADALNALAGWRLPHPPAPRILTPHPGEFRRLAPLEDRLQSARRFAQTHQVTVVLKGYRTVIAQPDGICWINPTGSPALAKAGSGDILTGLIAGFYAQAPGAEAVRDAVWLHGRCGELGAARWTDRCLIATDLLQFLPDAIRSAH